MELHLGQLGMAGTDIQRYARQLNLLELPTDANRLPKPSRLERWAEAAPPGFAFSLVVPETLAALEAPDPSALERLTNAAQILKPHWLIVRTPASVRPTSANRERLTRLVESIGGQRGGLEYALGWEAAGLWQEEETDQLAERLGVHVVRDARRASLPDAPIVYSRLLAVGRLARVSQDSAGRLAEKLADKSAVFLIVEGGGAVQLGRLLRAELSLLQESDEDEA